MTERFIHPMAIVESGAFLDEGVVIEAYAVVKASVKLGKNVTVKSHAYIEGNTTIGEGSTIWPGASIGTKTQDLKYRGEKTHVVIGKRCEIREFATINASCGEDSVVRIGDDCLIMAYCHVAHNCELGDGVIMANAAMLAGHVIVEDSVVIGGMTPIHQFCRIGRNAMVGGFSRITHDIPPYTIGAGSPYKLGGLNLVGLKRHRFSLETRKNLSRAFRYVYRSGLPLAEALGKIEKELFLDEHVQHWLQFCKTTKRGLIGLQNVNEWDELELEEDKELQEIGHFSS